MTALFFRQAWRGAGGVLLSVLFAMTNAGAWDSPGHALVGEIAYRQLNPQARAAAEALAAQMHDPEGKPYTPVTLACWMDDLRGNFPGEPFQGKLKPWHYVNYGIDAGDPEPITEPGQDKEEGGNAITAFKRALVVLKGGADPYIRTRPMALAVVEHLTGDIHQPLHAATYFWQEANGRWRNDAGGNFVKVTNGPQEEIHYNLHFFWDGAYRMVFDEESGHVESDHRFGSWNDHHEATIASLTDEFLASVPAPEGDRGSDFEAWAAESRGIARDKIYSQLVFTDRHLKTRLDRPYVGMAQKVARQRIILAGERLATLLNAILGAATPPPVPASYPVGTSVVTPCDACGLSTGQIASRMKHGIVQIGRGAGGRKSPPTRGFTALA